MEIVIGENRNEKEIRVLANSPDMFVWYCLYRNDILWALFVAYCKGTISIPKESLLPFINMHLPLIDHVKDKRNLTKAILNSKIKLQSRTLLINAWDINAGLWMLKTEWFIFKSIATFHAGSDTWNLPNRCKEYLEMAEIKQFNPDWDGMEELSDRFTNIEKEHIRASFLLNSF
jgi:hypothetical protein